MPFGTKPIFAQAYKKSQNCWQPWDVNGRHFRKNPNVRIKKITIVDLIIRSITQ
jgi:hypothetical protein